jgi:hypothetical protein
MKAILATILLCAPALLLRAVDPAPAKNAPVPPNPLIDYQGFEKIAREVGPIREKRRLTEEQFAAMAAEKGTIVLDARSADKFAMRHIAGAVSLPFTDFTADSLAKTIPTKNTRVLIYCNNNFSGAPRSMGAKIAVTVAAQRMEDGQAQQPVQGGNQTQGADPGRGQGAASLNISTYIALATYGYTKVYELGPMLSVDETSLRFVGTEVPASK